MFDLFSVTPNQLREVSDHHAANMVALLRLLVDKQIITEAEFDKARQQAVHEVEQAQAKRRDDAEKQFDEENPGVRDLFTTLLGGDKTK